MCGSYRGASRIYVSMHIPAKVKTVVRLYFWFLLLHVQQKSRNKTVSCITLIINMKCRGKKKLKLNIRNCHEQQNHIFILPNAWPLCESVTSTFCCQRFCICLKLIWGFLVFQHRYKRISHTNSHARGQCFVFLFKNRANEIVEGASHWLAV